jgi:acyl transferase domain-containing protein
VQALAAVYGQQRAPEDPLWIGSVKTNIGHLEGAAGIAGLIKSLLMLQHGEMPPHLNFAEPSPHIPWAELPIKVVTERRLWPADGRRRLAAVSSFGFSGTNVHVILEEAPATGEDDRNASSGTGERAPAHILALSARRTAPLQTLVARYRQFLQANPGISLADLCHTAGVGRNHFGQRLAVVCRDVAELQEKLAAVQIEDQPVQRGRKPGVVFQFTGQGAQYVGMGRELYGHYPLFKAVLDECDALLQPHLPRPLLSLIFDRPGETAAHTLAQTVYTQPALFAFEYALARLWQSWGVEPAAVIGHSVGEYVAACVAGVLSLPDALKLIAARGRLIQSLPQDGAMLAVFAAEDEVEELIVDGEMLSLAAVNGPDNVVVSGAREAVNKLARKLDDAGIMSRPLRVSHAFHSPLLDPILPAFRQIADPVAFQAPQIPLVSNVDGTIFAEGTIPDATYWTEHLRRPVRYYAGLQSLLQQGYTLFLEVGPKPVLTELGRRYAGTAAQWLASWNEASSWNEAASGNEADSGTKRREEPLLESLAACYTAGCDVNWESLYPRRSHRPLALPTYPFEGKPYWVEPSAPKKSAPAAPVAGNEALLNAFVDVLEETA